LVFLSLMFCLLCSLTFSCTDAGSCPWNGEMGSLQDHLKTCDYVQVSCSNEGCGRSMQRRRIAVHSQEECEHRLLPCRHCNNNFACIGLDNHIVGCARRPIECTNECGVVIAQADLAKHLSEQCNLRMVACNNQGCDDLIQQRHLAVHTQEECDYRLLPCPHCEDGIAAITWDDHIRSHCLRRRVECTNECGVAVAMGDLAQHLSEQCNLRMVACPLHAMGGNIDMQCEDRCT